MRISLVAALARNGVIGREGDLPWHLPADLKAFKSATIGKPVIMGRKTWDSIGKALPGRLNLVLSRNGKLELAGAQVCNSLDAALEAAAAAGSDEAMIIGGASLYAEALPRADSMILTRVHADIEGDRVFPDFDLSKWQIVERLARPRDEANAFDMEFVRYERSAGEV